MAIDRASYSAVSSAHEQLSKSEQAMIITQLNNAYSRYEIEVLHVQAVREMLYHLYNNKISSNQTISVLSCDFNMSLKGHNREVAKQLSGKIVEAFKLDNAGESGEAARTLLSARLNMNYLTSDEVTNVLRTQNGEEAKTAIALLFQIVQYQETLYKSVIQLAASIARRSAWKGPDDEAEKRLYGDVIEESDMIQEAVIAAKQAVLTYKPWLHNGQSFTSFVHNYVSGMLSKFINENTRVVAIPRNVMDRYVPLKAVIDNNPILTQYGRFDYEAIAREATAQRGTTYTAEEVEWLLLTVARETASLDFEIIDDDSSSTVTLSDSLLSQTKSQEALMDQATLKKNMLEIIRDYCTNTEFMIMSLRWESKNVRGLEKTAQMYRKLTGKAMNKSKVAQIEHDVLERLREANDSRLRELLTVLNESTDERATLIDLKEGGDTWCNGRRLSR